MSIRKVLVTAVTLVLTSGGATQVRAQCDPDELAKLIASDGAGYDEFGYAVAIDGDTAVVGAWMDNNSGGTDAGAAYVFVRETDGTWTQQAQLTASDAAAGDRFGTSVAIYGETALVGAPYANVGGYGDVGAAYVFVRGEGAWSEQVKLIPWDYQGNDWFGFAVAIDADTVLVGAFMHDTFGHEPEGGAGSGAVYVYVRTASEWSLQQELTVAVDFLPADIHFGRSVALSADTAVIGSPRDKVEDDVWAGSAYVFVRNEGEWFQQARLTASNAVPYDYFGWSVAVAGDTAISGAYQKDSFAGAAYAFLREGGAWTEQVVLTASDGAAGDDFGYSVAVSGDAALVGAPDRDGDGAVYVFSRTGTLWTEAAVLTASDGATGDDFGDAAAMSAGAAIVGACLDNNAEGTDAGAAYVFDLGCITPGDMDGDGVVDGDDIQGFIDCLLGYPGDCAAADLNGDSEVTETDVFLFIGLLLGE